LFFLHNKQPLYLRFAAHATGIDHIVFNHDFSIFATSVWDKTIHIYNYHELYELHELVKGVKSIDNLNSKARTLMLTTDNKLVAGMSDCTIRIWETSSNIIASRICSIVNRDMILDEWNMYLEEIPYEKTCGSNPQPAE